MLIRAVLAFLNKRVGKIVSWFRGLKNQTRDFREDGVVFFVPHASGVTIFSTRVFTRVLLLGGSFGKIKKFAPV